MDTQPRSCGNTVASAVRKHLFVSRKKGRIYGTVLWMILPPAIVCYVFTPGTVQFLSQLRDAFPTKGDDNYESDQATRKPLIAGVAMIVPMVLYIGMMIPANSVLIEIVSEKQNKMAAIQEVYGLSKGMYWLSWAAYYGCFAVPTTILTYVALVWVAPVFHLSNALLLVLLLLGCYAVSFSFVAVIAACAPSPPIASMLNTFTNLLLLSLAGGLQNQLMQGESVPAQSLAAMSLLPSSSIQIAISSALWVEYGVVCQPQGDQVSCHRGLGFATLFADEVCLANLPATSARGEEGSVCPTEAMQKLPLRPASAIGLLYADILLYAMLAWWIFSVTSSTGRRSACFCLAPSWWCAGDPAGRARLMSDPEEGGVMLQISRLRKTFTTGRSVCLPGTTQVAVEDMSLEVGRNEIFALLGHNGAGKTTAINCVVGLMAPTSGGARVDGYDVITQMEQARRAMSICPQDNPMYDSFTVRRHLLYFSGLRGLDDAAACDRVGTVLKALGIQDKEEALCNQLSGGQKRRLWVATALMVDSPFTFLDEPSSGMDPAARRELWALLQQKRDGGRSILFTTHYLDEADLLADRKAIMARGRVQASGTSHDLKAHFGLGYTLLVTPAPLAIEPAGGHDDKLNKTARGGDKLLRIVRSHVPEATETSSTAGGSQRLFKVPYASTSRLGPLLLELERPSMQISNLDICMSSLEEVFLALGDEAREESPPRPSRRPTDPSPAAHADVRVSDGRRSSAWRSIKALIRLRLISTVRSKNGLLNTLIPCYFVFMALQPGREGLVPIYLPLSFIMALLGQLLALKLETQNKCREACLVQGLASGPLADHPAQDPPDELGLAEMIGGLGVLAGNGGDALRRPAHTCLHGAIDGDPSRRRRATTRSTPPTDLRLCPSRVLTTPATRPV